MNQLCVTLIITKAAESNNVCLVPSLMFTLLRAVLCLCLMCALSFAVFNSYVSACFLVLSPGDTFLHCYITFAGSTMLERVADV